MKSVFERCSLQEMVMFLPKTGPQQKVIDRPQELRSWSSSKGWQWPPPPIIRMDEGGFRVKNVSSSCMEFHIQLCKLKI
jgi:hypothetical protein